MSPRLIEDLVAVAELEEGSLSRGSHFPDVGLICCLDREEDAGAILEAEELGILEPDGDVRSYTEGALVLARQLLREWRGE